MKNKSNFKKGISLIVLIITIIVIIILAGAVILNLTKNNPMDSAKISKLIQERETFESALILFTTKEIVNTMGEASTSDIIKGITIGTTAVVDVTKGLKYDTKELYQTNLDEVSNQLNMNLSTNDGTWYIEPETGKAYLIVDTVNDFKAWMGSYDTTTKLLDNSTLSNFVISKEITTALSSIGTDEKYFTWSSNGVEATITGLTEEGKLLTSIITPTTYQGFPVTGIGYNAFGSNNNLTSIVISDSVTKPFEPLTFGSDINLSNVVLSNSMTSLGTAAFVDCINLKNIDIPDCVTELGTATFQNTGLTEITIPLNVTYLGGGPCSGCTNLSKVIVRAKNLTFVVGLNSDKSKITEIVIEDTVETIGRWQNLTSETKVENIIIPDSVTSIDYHAFAGMTNLKTAKIGKNVENMVGYTFTGCTALTEVTMDPQGKLTTLGTSNFYGCTSLNKITLPYALTYVGGGNFGYCNALTTVNFGNSQEYFINNVIVEGGNDKLLNATWNYNYTE